MWSCRQCTYLLLLVNWNCSFHSNIHLFGYGWVQLLNADHFQVLLPKSVTPKPMFSVGMDQEKKKSLYQFHSVHHLQNYIINNTTCIQEIERQNIYKGNLSSGLTLVSWRFLFVWPGFFVHFWINLSSCPKIRNLI